MGRRVGVAPLTTLGSGRKLPGVVRTKCLCSCGRSEGRRPGAGDGRDGDSLKMSPSVLAVFVAPLTLAQIKLLSALWVKDIRLSRRPRDLLAGGQGTSLSHFVPVLSSVLDEQGGIGTRVSQHRNECDFRYVLIKARPQATVTAVSLLLSWLEAPYSGLPRVVPWLAQ
ncbi:hypothetical protein O3P69_004290 [Scylla paramamosain]|uniref:Uncharacterized protein n=1 Tax=Scylla paramamosain TaxID=85552 RepID=A0AAW0ULM7_SCYPA